MEPPPPPVQKMSIALRLFSGRSPIGTIIRMSHKRVVGAKEKTVIWVLSTPFSQVCWPHNCAMAEMRDARYFWAVLLIFNSVKISNEKLSSKILSGQWRELAEQTDLENSSLKVKHFWAPDSPLYCTKMYNFIPFYYFLFVVLSIKDWQCLISPLFMLTS